jgi:hypothetical protein
VSYSAWKAHFRPLQLLMRVSAKPLAALATM